MLKQLRQSVFGSVMMIMIIMTVSAPFAVGQTDLPPAALESVGQLDSLSGRCDSKNPAG